MTATDGQQPTENYFREEDDAWMRSVLGLVPMAVYGGNKTASSTEEKLSNSKKKTPVKKVEKKKKKKGPSHPKKTVKKVVVGDNSERSLLRKKLQEKISEKRDGRKADDEVRIAARAERKRKRSEASAEKSKDRKRLRYDNDKHKEKEKNKKEKSGKDEENVKCAEPEKNGKNAKEADGGMEVETTRISGFSGDGAKSQGKRRKLKGGKLRELQKNLEIVTREKQMEERPNNVVLEGDPAGNGSKGPLSVGKDKEMEKAIERAKGIEVRDDAKKLKKSIRKERRKTEKSKEEWAERVKAVETEKKEKQERRTKHLKERRENKGKSMKKSKFKKKMK